MEALKTSNGSFTPALLLGIGLLFLSALIVTQMKDLKYEERKTDPCR
jgi:hypothetical protein